MRPPIRPSRRTVPSEATPVNRLAITSGTTTIEMSLMKIVPSGSSTVTVEATASTWRATHPTMAPAHRPAMIFVWRLTSVAGGAVGDG